VELVPASAATLPPQKKPDFSTARPSRASRKRDRNTSEAAVVESSGDGSGREDDGWRVVSGGKEMVKRVKNSLVRKPVEITSSDPHLSREDGPMSMQQPLVTSETSQQQSIRPSPTCDGPGVALLLCNFIDAFRDMPTLDSDPSVDHCCCETCRPKASRAFRILEEVLLPGAEDLEKVGTHRYGDVDVEASQINDISPHKHGLIRNHMSVFVENSSDEVIPLYILLVSVSAILLYTGRLQTCAVYQAMLWRRLGLRVRVFVPRSSL
jgi:hypothetical protein